MSKGFELMKKRIEAQEKADIKMTKHIKKLKDIADGKADEFEKAIKEKNEIIKDLQNYIEELEKRIKELEAK